MATSNSTLAREERPNRATRRAEAASKKHRRPPPADSKHYLTAQQLRARYGGRSEMWLDRIMARDPTFPRHIYIGRLRFWALDEIEAYEQLCASRRVPEVA